MSTIVFEALTPPEPAPPATGDAALSLAGFGFARGVSEGALGDGELWLQAASGGTAPPPVAFCIGDGAVVLSPAYAFGAGVPPPATGDGSLPVVGLGSEAADVGDGAFVLTGFGSEQRSPPTSGGEAVRLSAGMRGRARLSAVQTALLAAELALAARPRARWQGTRYLRSDAGLADSLGLILHELLRASVALGDGTQITATAVEQMVDALLLGEAVGSELEALTLVAEAVALGAKLDPIRIGSLVSGLVVGASVAQTLASTERWVDALRLRARLQPSVLRLVVVTDRMLWNGTQRATVLAHEALRDQMGAQVRVHLESGEYVAWVMNTQSKSLAQYRNYPFNSFMTVGDAVYGATDTGLYRLGGDADAGQPIQARLRQGMSEFGTRVKKGFPAMYVGYTASGDLRLSVVAADPRSGERIAHAYRLRARAASSVREGRVKVGAGLQSIYFDYVIENIDGADFSLDVVEFLPLRLDRRVRGNSGGRR
ncbi:hypothetical protein PRJ39_04685 [Lysobacter enzymogenes]|uniref:hypothetical protein n=1 Tax=Lysobacter enzymogenes TaxID=69 RepID=UPI00374851B5